MGPVLWCANNVCVSPWIPNLLSQPSTVCLRQCDVVRCRVGSLLNSSPCSQSDASAVSMCRLRKDPSGPGAGSSVVASLDRYLLTEQHGAIQVPKRSRG